MQFLHKVAFRLQIRRIPTVQLRFIHLHTVMVFRYGHNILRTAFLKYIQPFVCIKFCGMKLLHHLSVIAVLAVGFYTVRPAFCSFQIHLTRIPLALRGGYAICTPMDKQSEPSLFIPLGDFESGKAFPIVGKRSLCNPFLHFLQIRINRCHVLLQYTLFF